MPKPVKKGAPKPPTKPKRSSDPNRAAHSMIAEHMERAAEQDEPVFDVSDLVALLVRSESEKAA